MTNNALAEHGRADRVDHRSFERQGMDRDPGQHFGPAAAYMVSRGLDHERLNDSAERDDHRVELGAIDSAIATLERERADLIDLESRTPSGSGEGGGRSGYTPGDTVDRDDDWMPGR